MEVRKIDADPRQHVGSHRLVAFLLGRGEPLERTWVRRGPDGVIGHAWVELDGTVLPELCEPQNRTLYRVNVRYPGTEMSPSNPETGRRPREPLILHAAENER